jgi:hypothetical protein
MASVLAFIFTVAPGLHLAQAVYIGFASASAAAARQDVNAVAITTWRIETKRNTVNLLGFLQLSRPFGTLPDAMDIRSCDGAASEG